MTADARTNEELVAKLNELGAQLADPDSALDHREVVATLSSRLTVRAIEAEGTPPTPPPRPSPARLPFDEAAERALEARARELERLRHEEEDARLAEEEEAVAARRLALEAADQRARRVAERQAELAREEEELARAEEAAQSRAREAAERQRMQDEEAAQRLKQREAEERQRQEEERQREQQAAEQRAREQREEEERQRQEAERRALEEKQREAQERAAQEAAEREHQQQQQQNQQQQRGAEAAEVAEGPQKKKVGSKIAAYEQSLHRGPPSAPSASSAATEQAQQTQQQAGSGGSRSGSVGEADLSSPEIAQAYRAIREAQFEGPDWLLLGYGDSRNVLRVYGTGCTGIEGLRAAIRPDECQRNKFVFLVIVPDSLGGLKKAKANMHKPHVEAFLKYFHITYSVLNPADLTEELVMRKLQMAAGANYGGGDDFSGQKSQAKSFFEGSS
eukprot:m51a1_g6058 hypothetical protein (449) ;mRNA; r:238083-240183